MNMRIIAADAIAITYQCHMTDSISWVFVYCCIDQPKELSTLDNGKPIWHILGQELKRI